MDEFLAQENGQLQTAAEEAALVGQICVDKGAIRRIAPYLRAEDFSTEACRAVYEAALDADAAGKFFDAYVAADVLGGKIENPRKFLAECIETAPTTANAEEYARLLRRKSDERNLRMKLSEVLALEHGEALTEAVAAICAEQIEGRPKSRMQKLSRIMERTYFGLFEKPKNRVDTGYGRLDAMLKGMWGDELIILAARPAVGKSAFAWTIAANVAKSTGKVVQVYSLEMEATALGEREMARWTRSVTMNDLIDKGFENCQDERRLQELAEAYTYGSRLPIYIDDSPNVKPSKVRSQALTQRDLGLIVVDYGGLMEADRKLESRNLELGAISRAMKNLAKELSVPVLFLAQLNRSVKDMQKPTLEALRDSGELEQNANKVLFIWNIDKSNRTVGVSVAKNRRGDCGEVVMRFDGAHMRFTETEERYEEPVKTRRGGFSQDED